MNLMPPRLRTPKDSLPLLANGDRMSQAEFHRRYQEYPEDVKFELVGGTVYMASPLRHPHSTYHQKFNWVFLHYEEGTPGVEACDNVTVILGEESEPQPDTTLRILAECGGQSRVNADQYVAGAPELLAEVAHSTRAIAMNQKREDYERTGVLEYLVLCIEEQELRWFHFPSGREITPNRQGISRSLVFPGLWIDVQALLQQNKARLREAVQQGMARRAHAAFVRRLEAARRRSR
jgi:Uma2 family endonuclease